MTDRNRDLVPVKRKKFYFEPQLIAVEKGGKSES